MPMLRPLLAGALLATAALLVAAAPTAQADAQSLCKTLGGPAGSTTACVTTILHPYDEPAPGFACAPLYGGMACTASSPVVLVEASVASSPT